VNVSDAAKSLISAERRGTTPIFAAIATSLAIVEVLSDEGDTQERTISNACFTIRQCESVMKDRKLPATRLLIGRPFRPHAGSVDCKDSNGN
jgi:hypothetical protein